MINTSMTLAELLALLRDLDIKLWVEDGRLRYDAPPGVLTPELISALDARKDELVGLLQQAGAAIATASPALDAHERPQMIAPLSFAQQRLWLLDQLTPGSPVYTMAAAVHLKGELDVGALERSLSEVVRRHEMLRTTFVVLDEQPVQVVGDPWPVRLVVDDLRVLPEAERAVALEQRIASASRQPFELARGPLLRGRLLLLGAQDQVLVLAMHHIVSDGWSVQVLIREVAELYAAFAAGRPSPLSTLAIQYADFAFWQRKWLRGDTLRQLLSYWQARLAGELPVLQLPLDRPRPAVQTYRGARFAFALPEALAKALDLLSRREGCTLFMTLLAAFQVLLARHSGQTDILVGTPIANRSWAEIEPLIGCFVNTLVLRSDLAGNPTFRELLAHMRATALGAYAHQDLPFEQLVEQIQPARDLGHTPVFQVLFDLQDAPAADLHLPGLELQLIEIDTGTAKFDLSLLITRGAGRLDGTFRFNSDLFETTTIERMAGHLQTLLEGATKDPDCRVADLPLLSDAERQQLLDWNATGTDYPRDVCFHHLVAAQAARTPEAIAVADRRPRRTKNQEPRTKPALSGGEGNQEPSGEDSGSQFSVLGSEQSSQFSSMSYAELNARANQVAHYLRGFGVGPETRVAVCLEHTPTLLVAILGVLKAGGAYVPLDPSYPAERLRFMLADAQVSVLLTSKEIRDWRLEIERAEQSPISNLQSPTQVYLDADWEQIARQPETNLDSGVTPGNLAYVLYTSGSTGTPKGVMIEHGSLVNYLCWVNRTVIGDTLRVLPAITKLTFDASLKQLLAPLLRGDSVWMLPDELLEHPAGLIEELIAHRHVGLNCVPSLWQAMLEPMLTGHVLPPADADLNLLLGGEQLSPELVAQSFDALPNLRLWNVYGPTETTANSSAGEVTSAEELTIGRPIANTQLYVLDARMHLVPVGVPGELYIGGSGVARGYLGRPDLTAERFIPNPFVGTEDRGLKIEDSSVAAEGKLSSILYPQSSTRLYRTGDLARYRSDGRIEFLGRADNQIKLRGFRIEPGEIAAALSAHPSVREVLVVAREDTLGEKRLVAYLVASPLSVVSGQLQRTTDNGQLTKELRQFLHDRLPDYMIPSAFVLLDTLPRLPNGKIDRRRLPAPDVGQPALAIDSVAPRTPIEQTLAEIWAELLGLTRVGVHDNFFALGGHSLLATRALARVRKIYGVTPSLRTLFEQPTIAALAAAIEASRPAPDEAPAAGGGIPKIARREQRARRILAQIDQLSDAQAERLVRDKLASAPGDPSDE